MAFGFGGGGSIFGARSSGSRPQQQMQPQRQMMGGQMGRPSNTMSRGIGPSPGMQQQRFIPPSQRPGGMQQGGQMNPGMGYRSPMQGGGPFGMQTMGQRGPSSFAQQNPNMISVSRQQMPGYAGGITSMDMVRNPFYQGGGQQGTGQGLRMGDMSPHFGGGQSLNPEYEMNRGGGGGQQSQTGIGPSQGPVMPPQDWAEDFLRRNPGDEHRLASAYRSELKY